MKSKTCSVDNSPTSSPNLGHSIYWASYSLPDFVKIWEVIDAYQIDNGAKI